MKIWKSKNVNDYDLRELHHVRLSSDTWDGSTHPMNGWVTDYYFCKDVCLFTHSRGFENGSREMRNRTGDEDLSDTLFKLKAVFDVTCALLKKMVRDETITTETVGTSLSKETSTLLEKHPTWVNLVNPLRESGEVHIDIDHKSGKITLTRQ